MPAAADEFGFVWKWLGSDEPDDEALPRIAAHRRVALAGVDRRLEEALHTERQRLVDGPATADASRRLARLDRLAARLGIAP
jgi:hypothetical protein